MWTIVYTSARAYIPTYNIARCYTAYSYTEAIKPSPLPMGKGWDRCDVVRGSMEKTYSEICVQEETVVFDEVKW